MLSFFRKMWLKNEMIVDDVKKNDTSATESATDWEKIGNFQMKNSKGTSLNRTIQFNNNNKTSNIQEITLLGYQNGDVKLYMEFTRSCYDDVINGGVKGHGYPQPSVLSKTCLLIIDIKNTASLEEILKTFAGLVPSIKHCIKDILYAYDPRFAKLAFCMGFHERVGKDSSILHAFGQSEIVEKQLVKTIFTFLEEEKRPIKGQSSTFNPSQKPK